VPQTSILSDCPIKNATGFRACSQQQPLRLHAALHACICPKGHPTQGPAPFVLTTELALCMLTQQHNCTSREAVPQSPNCTDHLLASCLIYTQPLTAQHATHRTTVSRPGMQQSNSLLSCYLAKVPGTNYERAAGPHTQPQRPFAESAKQAHIFAFRQQATARVDTPRCLALTCMPGLRHSFSLNSIHKQNSCSKDTHPVADAMLNQSHNKQLACHIHLLGATYTSRSGFCCCTCRNVLYICWTCMHNCKHPFRPRCDATLTPVEVFLSTRDIRKQQPQALTNMVPQ
jgi:hypothetical protein